MLNVTAKSVVGTPSKNIWSQAQNFKGEGIYGGVCLSLSHEGESDLVDLASIGSSVIAKIGEEIFKEKAVELVTKEIEEIETKEIAIDVVMYTIRNDELRMWGKGRVEVYLLRGESAALLGRSEQLIKAMSGRLKQGDVVALTTTNLKEVLGTQKLVQALKMRENASEELIPLIHKNENIEKIAANIVIVNSGNEDNAVIAKKFSMPMPNIIIKRMNEEPRKFNIVLGGVVIGILLLLALVGAFYRVRNNAKVEFESKTQSVAEMLMEASGVAESNPERARTLIAQGKDVLTTYIEQTKNEQYKKQALEMLGDLNKQEQQILKVSGAGLETFVELGVLSDSLRGGKMVEDGEGNIYFWDGTKSRVVGISVKDKSIIERKIEDQTNFEPFTVFDGEYIGVVGGGILKSSNDEAKIVIEKDELWGEIGQIAGFGNNIYLLDLGNGEIWKYLAGKESYSDRVRWLGKGVVLDLSKVIDWVVNGDIWLLTSSGKLERYSRGVPVKFEVSGLPTSGEGNRFNDPVAVAVDDEKVYVLERGMGRIVSLDLNGKYLGQQVAEELKNAVDLIVHENMGYALIGDKIKSFALSGN